LTTHMLPPMLGGIDDDGLALSHTSTRIGQRCRRPELLHLRGDRGCACTLRLLLGHAKTVFPMRHVKGGHGGDRQPRIMDGTQSHNQSTVSLLLFASPAMVRASPHTGLTGA